jgi:hypothetical protein
MKRAISKYGFEVVGFILGAVAGWCFWYFVGCSNGHCLITSRPLNSTLYGGLMGSLLLSIFKPQKKNNE